VFAKGSKYREPKSINWKHNFKMLMDSVEDYARQWAKREKEYIDTLSEWVKSVRSLIQIRIKRKLSGSMRTRSTSIFKDPNVAKHLSLLRPFGEHLSKRSVVDNGKVTSYNVASRIIYEWGRNLHRCNQEA
jgi:hypothetical protein